MGWSGALGKWITVAVLGVMSAMPSHATTVRYGLSNVAGTTWQYDFTVSNDSLASSIDEFSVFFDRTVFSNLQLVSAPAGWDPLAIQPDPGLPQDGFFDWLALGAGIGQGQSLGLFSVRVNFSGAATPGGSLFQVIDPTTFATLDQGFTTPAVAAIPEPETFALLAGGLMLTAWRARSRRSRSGASTR